MFASSATAASRFSTPTTNRWKSSAAREASRAGSIIRGPSLWIPAAIFTWRMRAIIGSRNSCARTSDAGLGSAMKFQLTHHQWLLMLLAALDCAEPPARDDPAAVAGPRRPSVEEADGRLERILPARSIGFRPVSPA